MPYEYRKLSPKEQEEVIRKWHEKGYPLHAPPHPYRNGGYYLISCSNYNHVPIMSEPSRRTEFETRMFAAYQNACAELVAWVVLPNHYHVLIAIDNFDLLPRALKNLHGSTSHEWNQSDNIVGRQVWYRYEDRVIRDQSQYFRAFNYIHFNPIKHGYVKDAYEWPWSSLELYYKDFGREWLRERWKEFPSKEYGDGWDDD